MRPVQLCEFCPQGALDIHMVNPENTEKLVVLPGFEVSEAKINL